MKILEIQAYLAKVVQQHVLNGGDARDLKINTKNLKTEDGQHFDHALRESVAAAIKRYPNIDAEWWIGPEAVLGEVERFLGFRNEIYVKLMNLTRDQIRQAVFDGIMDYYSMDEADDDDQQEASEITAAIMERIDRTVPVTNP